MSKRIYSVVAGNLQGCQLKKAYKAKILYILMLFLALASCKKREDEDDSDLRIVHGQKTDLYPAVRKLTKILDKSDFIMQKSICTAELIEPGVFVTAGHCVVCKKKGSPVVCEADHLEFDETYKPTRVQIHSDFPLAPDKPGISDVALVFVYDYSEPKDTVAPLRICGRSGVAGEPVTVVGYGQDSAKAGASSSSSGVKRFGRNKIENVKDRITIVGTEYLDKNTETNISILAPGDSGSPLIADCGVLGVASGIKRLSEEGKADMNFRDFYVDLSRFSIIEFMGNAIASKGWSEKNDSGSWAAVYESGKKAFNMNYESATKLCYQNDFAIRYRLPTIDEVETNSEYIKQKTFGSGCIWTKSKTNDATFEYYVWSLDENKSYMGKKDGQCQAFCVR